MDDQPLPIAGYVRQVRRRTKTSQRELATYLKLAHSTISRIESGARTPTIATFAKILRFAGLGLAVVDGDGRFCAPLEELAATRDWGGRRWPAHLGLILDPLPGEWWGDRYGLVRPPETVHRDPAARRRHREVFNRLRGVAAVSDIREWRERRVVDSRRLAEQDTRRFTSLADRVAAESGRPQRGGERGRQRRRGERSPPGRV